MRAIDIERIIRRGAASLGEGLHFYWPSFGANEIPERNISLHLGRVLLESGFLVFAEAHSDERTDTRVDLLAFQLREEVLLAGEFKRLLRKEEAQAMVADVGRLMQFVPQRSPELRHTGLKIRSSFGLVAATTWNADYAEWFASQEVNLKDPTGGPLDALWKLLPQRETLYGSAVLGQLSGATGGVRTHYLVYALFPLA